jgi:hypothetical protein
MAKGVTVRKASLFPFAITPYRLSIPVVLLICPWLAAAVEVTVDFDQVKREVPPLAYGINASFGNNPNMTGDSGYIDGLLYAAGRPDGSSSLVRLHKNGLVESWSSGGTWDADRIKTALKPLIDADLTGTGSSSPPKTRPNWCASSMSRPVMM